MVAQQYRNIYVLGQPMLARRVDRASTDHVRAGRVHPVDEGFGRDQWSLGKGCSTSCQCPGGARLGDAPGADESELHDQAGSVVDGQGSVIERQCV